MVQGRQIAHRDVVHTNVTIGFGWQDRIRILFGRTAHVDVSIYTSHDECLVVGSESKAWVEPIITRKEIGTAEIQAPTIPGTA
jgi:hypothetical protein